MHSLAVTGPHGAAAWVAWVFAIAAPVASVIVSVVALYIAGGDRRREMRDRKEKRLQVARMVTASVQVSVMTAVDVTVEVSGLVRNDADEPIQNFELTVWSARVEGEPTVVVLASHFLGRRSQDESEVPVRVLPQSLGLDRRSSDGHEAKHDAIRWRVAWTDITGQRWSRVMTDDPRRIDAMMLS